ncbi:MAG: hypothetical protein ACK5KM_10105 [Hyphomicrobiaceae bacterium]
MKAFLASLVLLVVIGIAAAAGLSLVPSGTGEVSASKNVRL